MVTQEEFDSTVASLKKRAANGEVDAMHYLGDALYQGPSGKEQNAKAAFPYYKQAADHGDVSVAGKVGSSLLNGYGCPKDQVSGLKYLKMHADSGDRYSQYQVGLCYETGIGCAENKEIAEKYYRMSSEQNFGEAQARLSYLYTFKRNPEWMHWLICAAMNGVEKAQESLNDMIQSSDDPSGFKENIEWQMSQIRKNGVIPQSSSSSGGGGKSGGCYVATAVYGSYDCPEVWTLRRYRDTVLASTWYGRLFIKIYYLVSPYVVRLFGNSEVFHSFWKRKLDPWVQQLQLRGYSSSPYEDKSW